VVHDEVLEKIDNEDLSVFAIWMPVLGSDNAEAAIDAESLLADPRARHYWDEGNSLGKLYGRSLKLPRGRQLAWDIYFVYEPGVRWDSEPPPPTQWMHQLGLDERHLDGDKLRESIEALLPTAKAAMTN